MGMLREIDLETSMVIIGLMTAVYGCLAVAYSVWLSRARERRMFQEQRNIFEHMLQQHAIQSDKKHKRKSEPTVSIS
jgi:hypothetical protein